MKGTITKFFKINIVLIALVLMAGFSYAGSCSLSGNTIAKPGEEVTLYLNFSGSDTVAVGVIYSYNSIVNSVAPGNASPWGSCEIDASQGQIGVGDYNGYDSGNWNYILNGSTTVMYFKIKISENAKPGDVAKFRLKTVYYATTANNMDQVLNQNLPTAGGGIYEIAIVGDEEPTEVVTPSVTDEPGITEEPTVTKEPDALDPTDEATPNPTKEATPIVTKNPDEQANPSLTPGTTDSVASSTPIPTKKPNSPTKNPVATPIPTATGVLAPEMHVTITPSVVPGDGDFIEKEPVKPEEIVPSIDDNYFDIETNGTVIIATTDDLGHTFLYEIAKDNNGTIRYYKVTVYSNGKNEYVELSEEQFSSEVKDIENYLADPENKDEYYEPGVDITVTKIPELTSGAWITGEATGEVTGEITENANSDITESASTTDAPESDITKEATKAPSKDNASASSDEENNSSNSFILVTIIVLIAIIIFVILYFLVIKRFKEHKHHSSEN